MKRQAKSPAKDSSPHPNVSVEKCREDLGERAASLTDAEIEQMRDFLYQLLDIAGDELEKKLLKDRSKADIDKNECH